MSLIGLHIYLNSNKHTQKIVSKNNNMNNKNRYNNNKKKKKIQYYLPAKLMQL